MNITFYNHSIFLIDNDYHLFSLEYLITNILTICDIYQLWYIIIKHFLVAQFCYFCIILPSFKKRESNASFEVYKSHDPQTGIKWGIYKHVAATKDITCILTLLKNLGIMNSIYVWTSNHIIFLWFHVFVNAITTLMT